MGRDGDITRLAKHLRSWKPANVGGTGMRYSFRACAERIMRDPQAHIDALVAAGVLYPHRKNRGAHRPAITVYNTNPPAPQHVAPKRSGRFVTVVPDIDDKTELAVRAYGSDPERIARLLSGWSGLEFRWEEDAHV